MRKDREYILFLQDMVQAIDKIFRYTEGYDFSRLLHDEKTLDAVIRNFEIIGEAANSIPTEIKQKYPDVPWKQMYGLRNYISHEYFGLDLSILWEIIQTNLPVNKEQIKHIIAAEA